MQFFLCLAPYMWFLLQAARCTAAVSANTQVWFAFVVNWLWPYWSQAMLSMLLALVEKTPFLKSCAGVPCSLAREIQANGGGRKPRESSILRWQKTSTPLYYDRNIHALAEHFCELLQTIPNSSMTSHEDPWCLLQGSTMPWSALTVQAAWKNTAFASELGKCALAAKYKEIDHLYKELCCCAVWCGCFAWTYPVILLPPAVRGSSGL